MVNKPIGPDEDRINQRVALRIEAARVAAGVSQAAVADALGISITQFQKNEGGGNRVSAGRLFLIAKLCKKPVSWFFGGVSKDTEANDRLADFFSVPRSTEVAALFARVPAASRQSVINVLTSFAKGD